VSYSEFRLLFGDLHGHSNLSGCGVCPRRRLLSSDCYLHSSVIEEYKVDRLGGESVDLFYEYARDKARLDFAALTDHDFQLSDEDWKLVRKKAWEWYSPGRFVTFSAYEWTSYAYGHRNVYFLGDEAPIFRCVDYGDSPYRERGWSPRELWEALRKAGVRAITVPHHPSLAQFPVDWSFYDPGFDRLVEVASIWGVFEYYGNPYACPNSDNPPRYFVADALARGYRLGLVGGGDTHDCMPGGAFRSVIVKNFGGCWVNPLSGGHVNYFVYNALGGGLAGVYARELTREAVFEALYRRRVYAVIGARLRLEFSVDGLLMGEEGVVEEGHQPVVRVSVEGEDLIDRVEVIRDGRVVHRRFGSGRSVSFRWVDEDLPLSRLHYYYVRVVQRNGARAWSSPVWLQCNVRERFVVASKAGVVRVRSLTDGLTAMKFKEQPLRLMRRPKEMEKAEVGSFFWLEGGDGWDLVFKARFKSVSRSAEFRGSVRLFGFADYDVRPVGFAFKKYGGDLFSDTYDGRVEWFITVGAKLTPLDESPVKGLDVPLQLSPFQKAWLEVEVYHDGAFRGAETFLGSVNVGENPFRLFVYSPGRAYESLRLRVGEIVEVKRGFLLVFPGKVDERGVGALILEA